MKNNLLVAAGLAAFTALVVGRRKHNGVAEHKMRAFNGKVKGQKTVLYPISDPNLLDASITWYNKLFSMPEGPKTGSDNGFPYAVYKLDDFKVRLDTNPDNPKLSQTIFYWILASAGEVVEMNARLKAANAAFAEELTTISKPSINPYRGSTDFAQEVKAFVVIDLDQNRVGVTNNPIYPPPLWGE